MGSGFRGGRRTGAGEAGEAWRYVTSSYQNEIPASFAVDTSADPNFVVKGGRGSETR